MSKRDYLLIVVLLGVVVAAIFGKKRDADD